MNSFRKRPVLRSRSGKARGEGESLNPRSEAASERGCITIGFRVDDGGADGIRTHEMPVLQTGALSHFATAPGS